MKTTITRTFISALTLISANLYANNYPFPQNIDYHGISPNNASTTTLNQDIKTYYDYWKSTYLRAAATGGYYVHGADTDGHGKGTSESHGYGMVITALMAGYDENAKAEFDGMWDFFDRHRSILNSELMGWKIDGQEASGIYSSAADGDMDIAYALLLADKQWSSTGAINYRKEAIDMINQGLKVSIYNSNSKRLMLGDWDSKANTTRSSDWMPGHLRAYYDATGDAEWLQGIAKIYEMVEQLNSVNNDTGLMPDFVTGQPARPDLNNDNGTGEKNSGDYFYNAARTPLRLAMDYIHNGAVESKLASEKVTAWVKEQIGSANDFSQYYSGYTVSGELLKGANYTDTVFIAPVVVAASANESNQQMVNAGWNFIKNRKQSYFSDTVNLMSMLALTGNWWAPNQVNSVITDENPTAYNASAQTDEDQSVVVSLNASDDGQVVSYQIASLPTNGTVNLNGNKATYSPDNGFTGSDSFTFTVTDNDGNQSNTATVQITVNAEQQGADGLLCDISESVWNTGFSATVTITNSGNQAVNGWQIEVPLSGTDEFDTGWSANFQQLNNAVRLTPLSWNQTIPVNGSVQMGFNGKHAGQHASLVCNLL